MTEATEDRGQGLIIENGWLAEQVNEHTCAGGTPESGYAHERGCGLEPLMKVADLVALFDVLTELGLPVNRPDELRKHIADAEQRGRQQVLDAAITVVVAEPPGPTSQFVEVEDDGGRSIRVGEWSTAANGWGHLRITIADIVAATGSGS